MVLDRNNSRIRVVAKDKPGDLRKGGWRLDKGANRVAHDRMHEALISFHSTEETAALFSEIYYSVSLMIWRLQHKPPEIHGQKSDLLI